MRFVKGVEERTGASQAVAVRPSLGGARQFFIALACPSRAQEARLGRIREQLEAVTIRTAVRAALLAAKVTPTQITEAMMSLAGRFRFVVHEDDHAETGQFCPVSIADNYRVTVMSEFGEITVEVAVSNWLASPEAAGFQPKTPTHQLGPCAMALRRWH